MWLLLRGRLSVRDRLIRMNLLSAQLNTCPIYGDLGEDISHLFIHCRMIGPIWYKDAFIWEFYLVCPHFIPKFFEYWFHAELPSRNILAQCLAFYTLIWSIWNVRNRAIFRQVVFKEYACLEPFCYHFVWQVKKALKDVAPTLVDISRYPRSVTFPPARTPPRHHISWSPLLINTIKVNTD